MSVEALTEQLAAKKAASVEAKKARESALEEKWLALQLQAIELEEKYETEIGRRGDKWDLFVSPRVHVDDGIFVVKRPEKIVWNTYEDSEKTKTDAFHLVLATIVHPAKDVFTTIANDRPALVWHVAGLLGKLVGVEVAAEAGK